jgi:uncharacterized protein (DUF885 family)
MIRKLGLGVAAVTLSVSAVFGNIYADDKASFHALLSEHWARANAEQIFFRTDPDAFRPNGKLPEFTSDARARRQTYNKDVLERLKGIDEAMLSGQDRISYKLFKYERETEAESYRQPDHLFPITKLFGYHTYFANAPYNMSFSTQADYDRYLVSLADFPRYNRENIDLLKEATGRGFTHYCASMAGYENTISMHVVDNATESNLYHPFTVFPATFTDAEKADLAAKGKALIAGSIIPSYRELYEFFTKDYMPKCRTDVGITSVPGGDKYYQYLINYFTTTDMSPREIHELGLAEAKRIRSEMEAIIRQVGFEGTFKEFLNFLRTDPHFFAKTGQELLEKTAFIAKKMDGQMPRFFGRLARNTYEIRGVTGRSAYYVSGSGDGRTPGTYFISVGDLKSQPLYNLEALSLHEGVPGHHHQTAIALELDVPEFRKTLYHSAFGEGWGLYSEALGKEAGFYTDPYSDFGRLTYEMWRANRLVVDTGMHALGWSREQAITYMLASSALTEGEVTAEIDRYITWPAQALSYKIGELRIKAMRLKAEKELGANFDLRTFHDTIVGNGSLAIAVLEEIVDEWIAGQK